MLLRPVLYSTLTCTTLTESRILNRALAQCVLLYLRFRDDILIVADASRLYTGVSTFTRRMADLAGWWEVTLDDIGEQVQFLNFTVFVSQGRIHTKPYYKPLQWDQYNGLSLLNKRSPSSTT